MRFRLRHLSPFPIRVRQNAMYQQMPKGRSHDGHRQVRSPSSAGAPHGGSFKDDLPPRGGDLAPRVDVVRALRRGHENDHLAAAVKEVVALEGERPDLAGDRVRGGVSEVGDANRRPGRPADRGDRLDREARDRSSDGRQLRSADRGQAWRPGGGRLRRARQQPSARSPRSPRAASGRPPRSWRRCRRRTGPGTPPRARRRPGSVRREARRRSSSPRARRRGPSGRCGTGHAAPGAGPRGEGRASRGARDAPGRDHREGTLDPR